MKVGEPADEPVGTLAEETAKLFEAMSSSVGAHASTSPTECEWCPVCRGIRFFHDVDPEVRTHLVLAATSLFHAVSKLLASESPARADDRRPHDAGPETDEPTAP